MKLSLIGLGVKSGDISVNAFERLKQATTVVVRTENTLSARFLKEQNISYVALDGVYLKSRNFDTLTNNIVKEVSARLKTGDVCYLVDGSVYEDRCARILAKRYKDVLIFDGASKVNQALIKCGISEDGYTAVSAYSIDKFKRYSFPIVVYDLDSALLASEWKLKLFEIVGEEQQVRLYADDNVKTIRLYELDMQQVYDYSTVLVVGELPLKDKTRFDFYDILDILAILRAPDGCPWDRVQTPESIRINLVEEAYELVDAIDKQDDEKIREETGDVLMQVAFHMTFLKERGAYLPSDVTSALGEKLITRHTHIFGDDKATDAQSALQVWNKNKQIEKGYDSAFSYVDDVPKCLPALLRTEKVIKRSINRNFKIYEQGSLIARIKDMLDSCEFEGEKGAELMFLTAYLLKLNGASLEQGLSDRLKKYIESLNAVEQKLLSMGLSLSNADAKTVLEIYEQIEK